MFPIKRTVFFSSVTVVKNTVLLIGNIEYAECLIMKFHYRNSAMAKFLKFLKIPVYSGQYSK